MVKSRRFQDHSGRAVTGARKQAALRALRRAQRLMETGQYAQAYPALKRLANSAARDEMPARAAHLYVQAARARLEMGGASDAANMAQCAVQLLAGAGQVDRAGILLARLIQAMRTQGRHDLAVSLRAQVAALVGRTPQAASARQGALPARCPSCAGPIRPDEVSWIDDRNAACGFCGAVVGAG
jgi:hypothetical protein